MAGSSKSMSRLLVFRPMVKESNQTQKVPAHNPFLLNRALNSSLLCLFPYEIQRCLTQTFNLILFEISTISARLKKCNACAFPNKAKIVLHWSLFNKTKTPEVKY